MILGIGWVSCDDEVLAPVVPDTDEGMVEPGTALSFSLKMPNRGTITRATDEETAWRGELDKYKTIAELYNPITVTMTNMSDDPSIEAQSFEGQYKPIVDEEGVFDPEGDLQPVANALYWQDNVQAWGFEADAGNHVIEADQSTEEKLLKQDHIHGYGYLPLWDETDNQGAYDLEGINYRVSKQWFADHKTVLSQLMTEMTPEEKRVEYRKIPLYMRHQFAKVTVRLSAGDGVNRTALAFRTHERNIEANIHNYLTNPEDNSVEDVVVTLPFAAEHLVNYEKDKNGPAANNVSSVQYSAIVYPHNYLDNDAKDPIMSVNVSGLKFTFSAMNDRRYPDYYGSDESAREHHTMQLYNLTAGKHLIIDARLTSTRLIFITAWVVDWVETVTNTICDDYGQNGDPIVIKNRAEFIEFLNDEKKNKPGNVAIFQATQMWLDSDTAVWEDDKTLKATLNLAGATIYTRHRVFKELTNSATIINGNIEILDGTNVDAAIAQVNRGIIERVSLNVDNHNDAVASKGGLVDVNYGNIIRCTSNMPVMGQSGTEYVGGIAAVSVVDPENLTVTPIIDGCTVDARVDGVAGVKGGGIVGNVTGRVTNNTFEYGITVLQDKANFKNIFAKADSQTTASKNAWPTEDLNPISVNQDGDGIGNENQTPSTQQYKQVIDSENELAELLKATYNQIDQNYRLSASFSVSSDTWQYGKKQDLTAPTDGEGNVLGNLLFNLDGNNKMITLTGTKKVRISAVNGGEATEVESAPMLFANITGMIKDVIIYLDKPVVSEPNTNQQGELLATDAISPLAYNLIGPETVTGTTNEYGTLRNVTVVAGEGAYVQSGTPAGLVVWATNGATITNCHVQTDVRMFLPQGTGQQSYHFAGGVVACAAEALIQQTQYNGSVSNYGYDPTLVPGEDEPDYSKQPTWYNGGIVGGTMSFLDQNHNEEKPSLAIVDCSSWFNAAQGQVKPVNGSIIGIAAYSDTGNLIHGMRDDNMGNWWTGLGVAVTAAGYTQKQAIGVKNSYEPTFELPELP